MGMHVRQGTGVQAVYAAVVQLFWYATTAIPAQMTYAILRLTAVRTRLLPAPRGKRAIGASAMVLRNVETGRVMQVKPVRVAPLIAASAQLMINGVATVS